MPAGITEEGVAGEMEIFPYIHIQQEMQVTWLEQFNQTNSSHEE